MEKTPIVSVLMTSYNREKYISTAISSVLASTFKDFELIILDDCSIDKTVQIANEFAARDNRIRVYSNEKNLGDYPNRNKAAGYAKGLYLKYVDADDYIYPWGLELLVKMMDEHPQVAFGLCSLEQDKDKPFPIVLSSEKAYEYHYLGPGLFHKAPLSSVIKKDAFLSVGGFSEIRMAGDFDMWNKLGAQFNVLLMPQGIVWYREHDSQEMNSYSKYEIVYEQIALKYIKSPNFPGTLETSKKILKKRKKYLLKSIMKNLLKLNFSILIAEYKKLRMY